MPLGLVAGVRTQGQGWPFQEVHHCATHVMVAYREKIVRIYTDLTTTLLIALPRVAALFGAVPAVAMTRVLLRLREDCGSPRLARLAL